MFNWLKRLYYNNLVLSESDLINLTDFKVDGVNFKDYPDFVDAYISEAYWSNGIALTDNQLDQLNEFNDFVYDLVFNYIY